MGLVYTESQKKAIGHRKGNLLILACAGSGKTEVISRRIAGLVDEGVERGSIVAFTFTERAAGELKARIRKHLEDILPHDPGLGDMYVGTIHSFCMQLLKELDGKYRNFEVIDEEQQAAFLASNYYDLELHKLQNNHGCGWFQTVRKFKSTLTALHLEAISGEEISDEDLRGSVGIYRKMMSEWPYQFLDFNSIIGKLIEVLKSNARLRKRVQAKLKHVIVDEYQDIDPRQEELINLLVGGDAQLCVVGDDDQAIYGWRGAEVKNILTFEKRYKDVSKIEMVENFRSSHAITEIANRAVRKLGERLEKSMLAMHWEAENGSFRMTETMAELGDIQRVILGSPEDEARYIADRIEYLRGIEIEDSTGTRGLDWGDMAVLYRSVRRYATPLVDELRRRNIPCVVQGTRGLFEHDEVLLVQAILHLIAGEDLWEYEGNETSILGEIELRERVRDLSKRLTSEGMPGLQSSKILEWIGEKKRHLDLASLRKELRPKKVSRRIFPQDIFHEIMEAMGAAKKLWNESIMYNLGRLSSLITKYEAIHQWLQPNDLRAFLRFLGNWTLDEGGADEADVLNAVQILTIHKAKGLEWPAVFVPSIFSYHFPSSRRNQGMDTFLPGTRYATGDDGERRLWYVALTRSRKFLHVSSVDRPRCRPQVFIKEIKHSYVLDSNSDQTERTRREPKAPVNTEVMPTTFSDLAYYWDCPHDYQLRKLMGFGPKIGQEFGYGQQIHNLLAIVHETAKEGNVLRDKEIEALVEKNFSLRYTSAEPFEKMKRAALSTVRNYVKAAGKKLADIIIESEKPFEFVMENALISGTIDLLEQVDETSGQYLPVGVVDFKTGIDDDPKVLQERMAKAEKQVTLYVIAARDALRLDPRRAYIHFLDTKNQLRKRVNIGEEERAKLAQKVGKTVTKIIDRKFPRVPIGGNKRCVKCDFRKMCPGKDKKK